MTSETQRHDGPLPAELSSREAKIMLWTVGHLDKLKKAGSITMSLVLYPCGEKGFEALCRSGYEPTEYEVRTAIRALMIHREPGVEPDVELVNDLFALIQEQKGASK